ncbi:MAG: hypothetical protein QMC83_01890 [Thermodesulfovibrionales bacterium]|nr:hypothetical protein [Thermodesulfovibrionales bacterium]
MQPTGSELRALKIINEEGGEIPVQVVSRRMGIEITYARLLCTSLARADYIDLSAAGMCRITAKGKAVLGK